MRLEVPQPILDFADMARLREIEKHTGAKFKSYELDITYPLAWGDEGVEAKLASLCAESVDAIRSGHNILIISDRRMDRDHVADSRAAGAVGDPPAPGARGPAHDRRPGRRDRLGARSASLRRARRLRRRSRAPVPRDGNAGRMHKELPGDLSAEKAIYNYVKAVGKGLSKIMSKMGVSTYMSYCGAQLFEAIGLEKRLWSTSTSAAPPARSAASACSRSPRKRSACTAPPSATTRCSPACSTPAANTPGACAAKSTCGRPMRSPSCSTAARRTSTRPTRNTRSSSTTSRSAT